jgi:hypothetical protein
MTRTTTLPELFVLTLRDPREAADIILGWNLSKEALWTAIALVSVIVTILSTISNIILPVPAPLNAIVGNPFIYFIIAAGGFVATVHAMYWTGRMLGGRGRIEDLMVLLLWLQAMRAVAQAAVVVLLVLAPAVASLLVLLIAMATLWVFINFISIGLHLESMTRAVVVLLLGALLLVVGLSFFLSLTGLSGLGVSLNV